VSPAAAVALILAAVLFGGTVSWVMTRTPPPADAQPMSRGSLDIPVPPETRSTFVRRATERSPFNLTCVETDLSQGQTAAFLRTEMKRRGWEEDLDYPAEVRSESGQLVLCFKQGDNRLIAGLQSTEDGGTRITNLGWKRRVGEEGSH
jgi:hypothetical protein